MVFQLQGFLGILIKSNKDSSAKLVGSLTDMVTRGYSSACAQMQQIVHKMKKLSQKIEWCEWGQRHDSWEMEVEFIIAGANDYL